MKIKLEAIVNNVESLKNIQQVKLPAKVAYRIKRLVDRLSPILKTYEEKRYELVKEYGEEMPGEKLQVKKEKMTEFMAKLTDLQSVEEEVEFEPIKISEIGDAVIEAKDLVDFVFTDAK